MQFTYCTVAACGLFVTGAAFATAQDDQPVVQKDDYAVALIQRAADYLGEQEHFSVTAEIWQDTLIDGKLLQFGRTVDMMVSRPGKVRLDMATTDPTRSIYVDGKTVTMVDYSTNFYGVTDAAGTLDETIVMIDEKFDVQFPMEDVLLSKPFGSAAANAKSAQYLGATKVLGVDCDHVAFQHDALDWQAWIETGPMPVLRKVVISFKNDPTQPTTTAIFSDWDVLTPMPDFLFEFTPLSYQTKIEVLPPAKPADKAKE